MGKRRFRRLAEQDGHAVATTQARGVEDVREPAGGACDPAEAAPLRRAVVADDDQRVGVGALAIRDIVADVVALGDPPRESGGERVMVAGLGEQACLPSNARARSWKMRSDGANPQTPSPRAGKPPRTRFRPGAAARASLGLGA
jgi:hypothetical protein